MEIDNSYFERVEEFKYLGRTLTNQNPIQEQIYLIYLLNPWSRVLLEKLTGL
jgi:hypothetical protein